MTDFLSQILTRPVDELTLLHWLAAFAIAYAGGFLASLTPCVYPMIPITMSVVGGLGSGKKTGFKTLLIRGIFYVGGMTLVYSLLGVIAGLTGRVFGTFTNTPGWYFGLSIVMTLSALVMMDILPFDLPAWWEAGKRRFGFHRTTAPRGSDLSQNKEATLFGAFALGMSSGFVAAPCTTPILTSILAFITKTQSIGLGLGLMFFFSIGLGTLLLALAAAAGSFTALPKSGRWMKTIKTASGILLLAFAQYLIYQSGLLGGLS